jgi:tRNA-2-methylthio-N6-dimethylallyladenosine synthase
MVTDKQMKYHIVTLGCQMNKSDSERVRTVIEGMGYCWTDSEEEADLIGVLACSVRQKSIDKVYSKIAKWNKWKDNRNLLTFISGCILPADRVKFLKLFNLLFTIAELPELPDMIRQYGVVNKFAVVADLRFSPAALYVNSQSKEKIREFWMIRPSYVSNFEAFIPIQNGCDKFCSFCAVPFTRGREISRPSAEILEELKTLVNRGYKSITLLGQNVNSYGKDKDGFEISFAELLRKIGEYGRKCGHDFWVYFTSPHPRDMSNEVLDIISRYECLAKQIHLPLQSGDNLILSRMNRKHTFEDYNKIIHAVRSIIPDATLFTDIIVGFPGETDEQFKNTRRAMETIVFNMAYIAAYSPRPGASSARLNDDIPMSVKKMRLHLLTEELEKHSLQYNKSLIGKNVKVLVTGYDRKENYMAGITEGRIVVRFTTDIPVSPGVFVWLRITSAAPYSIEGELIRQLTQVTASS